MIRDPQHPLYVSNQELQHYRKQMEAQNRIRNQGIGVDYYAERMRYGSTQLKSLFMDPFTLQENGFGGITTISQFNGRSLSFKLLRRVAEKCWIINLCTQNVIRKIRPFLKPATTRNVKGFKVYPIHKDAGAELTEAEKKAVDKLNRFFMATGFHDDDFRVYDLDMYVTAIIRDVYALDQVACELQRNYQDRVTAFWAVDPATIERAMPYVTQETGIRYVQVVDSIPYAVYGKDDLIVQYMNARTDIERAGYGYSVTEQSIDLVTSSINTFMYNAGYFQENKLPHGMLLLNGNPSQNELDTIEEYLVNLLSGNVTNQWRIPVIPTGMDKNGGGSDRKFEFVKFDASNREMEFKEWFDLQLSAIAAMFGASLEDLGIHSNRSTSILGNDEQAKIAASKTQILGDTLSFLEKHFNHILNAVTPQYRFEFVGYEIEGPEKQVSIDKQELEAYKTIDEKRIERGLEPLAQWWSQVPANPQVVQMVMADHQQAEGDGGNPFGGFAEGTDYEDEEPVEKALDTKGEVLLPAVPADRTKDTAVEHIPKPAAGEPDTKPEAIRAAAAEPEPVTVAAPDGEALTVQAITRRPPEPIIPAVLETEPELKADAEPELIDFAAILPQPEPAPEIEPEALEREPEGAPPVSTYAALDFTVPEKPVAPAITEVYDETWEQLETAYMHYKHPEYALGFTMLMDSLEQERRRRRRREAAEEGETVRIEL